MLSTSSHVSNFSIPLCKSLLQVLNTWSPTSDARRLATLIEELARTTAHDSQGKGDDDEGTIRRLVVSLREAVDATREGVKGAAGRAIDLAGEILARLAAGEDGLVGGERCVVRERGVPEPRTLFIHSGSTVHRAQYPAPLTPRMLHSLLAARVPGFEGVNADSGLSEDVYVWDPPSGVWYSLDHVDDIGDRAQVRVGTLDGKDLRAARSGTPQQEATISAQRDEIAALRASVTTLQRKLREAQNSEPAASADPRATAQSNSITSTTAPPISAEIYHLQSTTSAIEARIDGFRDIVESLVQDAGRRVRPAGAYLAALGEDAQELQADIAARRRAVERARPVWKAAWARGLEEIVAQQTVLTREENVAEDLDAAHAEVVETVEKLRSLADLLRDAVGGAEEGEGYVPAVLGVEEAEGARLGPVLEELRVAIGASAGPDRMRGVEHWARVREWKIMAEKRHGENLRKWIREAVLADTGGVEQVERMRAVKDAENLKRLYT